MYNKILHKIKYNMGFFSNTVEKSRELFKLAVYHKYWILALIVFLSAGLWFYINYIVPKFSPTYVANKEFVRDDVETTDQSPESASSGPVDIIFYYTNWCPYCKKARPEWDKIKEDYNGKIINHYQLFFREVDCDAKENASVVKENNIDGYPTIVMNKDDKNIEYDAKPEYKTLELFINSVLND